MRLVCRCRLTGGEDVAEWCDKLNEEAGVLLLPGTVYSHEGLAAAGHFRVGLGRDSFAGGIAAMAKYLAK